MLNLKRLVMISRPLYYLPVLVLFAGGLTASHTATFLGLSILAAFFLTLPMGLIVYGVNDIADRESDSTNPRKGGADGTILHAGETEKLKKAVFLTTIISLFTFLATQQYGVFIAASIICLFAYTYSVPPFRFKTRPVLDSLSNGLWGVAVLLTGYWANVLGPYLPLPSLRLISIVFLCVTAYHILGAAMDYEVDRANNDSTICVALGKTNALLLCSLSFLACAVLVGTRSLLISCCLLVCALLVFIGCRYNSPKAVRRIAATILFLIPITVVLVVT